MENIVYLELKRRGFEVYVGKNDRFEVDFIAERKNERIYLQVVAYSLSSEETIDKECTQNEGINRFRATTCQSSKHVIQLL